MVALLIVVSGLLAFKIAGQSKEDEFLSGDRSKRPSGTAEGVGTTQGGTGEEAEADKERKKPAPRPEIKKRPKDEEPPVAKSVPGKQGYVFSPINGKLVDVRDIPPGTLVQDPSVDPSEKAIFRVPPDENSAEGAEGK